jgi:hypothetical protein
MGDNQYANMTWPARWNAGEVVAALSQSGADVMATGFFGVVRFRLDDTESVAAIVNGARQFATMVEGAKRSFDGRCDRCGEGPAPHWTGEICSVCDPVQLCATCFTLHKQEVADDAAAQVLHSAR